MTDLFQLRVDIRGAVLGPDEFLEGLALGTHQFLGGTVGQLIMLDSLRDCVKETHFSFRRVSWYGSQGNWSVWRCGCKTDI